ncbi:hypothetical protein GUJ93_ZPchr0001g29617 [Zizania palustris]|uniref:Uncharacterized protein n=1 Tax=Zizania palustris TaxID=103762 RepID=A0A8J5VMT7_ZIZPA|nr:hypothetical protein GUJ93_ZPchr0001g29617 [Zizania palustris]
MDCVLQIVLEVVLRRSICRLQEVVGMAMELGTALLMAVRFSGMDFRRRQAPSSSPAIPGTTTTYYYSPVVAASMMGMSRLDRH